VQALFKNEEDLLGEFKDFLPEIAGTSSQQGLVGIRPYPPDGPSTSGAMWSHETTSTSPSVPKGTQAPSRRRKREQPKEPPPPSKQAEPARVSGNRDMTRRNWLIALKGFSQAPTCGEALCETRAVTDVYELSNDPIAAPWLFPLQPTECIPVRP
jgi:paired amphipathic helix protein Sin3a